MTIYEANNKLIRVGNAMIIDKGLRYFVVSRVTTEINESCKEFSSVKDAYGYAEKLPNDFSWNNN